MVRKATYHATGSPGTRTTWTPSVNVSRYPPTSDTMDGTQKAAAQPLYLALAIIKGAGLQDGEVDVNSQELG